MLRPTKPAWLLLCLLDEALLTLRVLRQQQLALDCLSVEMSHAVTWPPLVEPKKHQTCHLCHSRRWSFESFRGMHVGSELTQRTSTPVLPPDSHPTPRFECEDEAPVLYVYELQVALKSQKRGLGSWLMAVTEWVVSHHGKEQPGHVHTLCAYMKSQPYPTAPVVTREQNKIALIPCNL